MAQRGFTLIELMVTVAVIGILTVIAVPSFVSTNARARLEGALNELSIDLQYARSEAVRERAAVSLTVADSGSSYTISNAGSTLKTVTLPGGVSLTPSATVTFDSLRGMSGAATFTGSSSGVSGTLLAGTNALGRVKLCSPSGGFSGYPSC